MTKTIWKFALKVTDKQIISMPQNSKVLTAQVQNGEVFLWAMVDPDKTLEAYPVWIHGTGHPVKEAATEGKYISSVQLYGGSLIFHVFVGEEACK